MKPLNATHILIGGRPAPNTKLTLRGEDIYIREGDSLKMTVGNLTLHSNIFCESKGVFEMMGDIQSYGQFHLSDGFTLTVEVFYNRGELYLSSSNKRSVEQASATINGDLHLKEHSTLYIRVFDVSEGIHDVINVLSVVAIEGDLALQMEDTDVIDTLLPIIVSQIRLSKKRGFIFFILIPFFSVGNFANITASGTTELLRTLNRGNGFDLSIGCGFGDTCESCLLETDIYSCSWCDESSTCLFETRRSSCSGGLWSSECSVPYFSFFNN